VTTTVEVLVVRFGLFGTGHWAAETHGAALHAHPGVAFAGVWGRDARKAAALAERYGVPAFDDADALIDACDAVAVALPPDVRRASRSARPPPAATCCWTSRSR
jgi:predicted dehydrogenase